MPSGPAATRHEPVRVSLHGRGISYLDVGQGPVVVFVHGLLGSHRNWLHLVDDMAATRRVIAPDLFGHGASSKQRGDYSLGAHAAALRDLLDHLRIGSVTLVGHSLGGGISLQLAYLFPERVDRLVLVSSGGLGRELGLLLRAPALPGAELVMPLVASTWVRRGGRSIGRGLVRLGRDPGHDVNEAWRGFLQLGDAESRQAFITTVRSVIDPGGQMVSADDRLSRITVPVLVVWGGRDRLIPMWHGARAAQRIPGSRLEVFENAGHFPHLDDPERFARVLREFIEAG